MTFTQISAAVNSYRDAVRFANGRELRLQELREGMRVRCSTVAGRGAGSGNAPHERAEFPMRTVGRTPADGQAPVTPAPNQPNLDRDWFHYRGFEDRASASEILSWAIGTYGDSFAIATSFQKEGMVIVDLASRISSRRPRLHAGHRPPSR